MSNNIKNERETWIGYRPSVMPAKKKNKKHERKEGKQICREAMKEDKINKPIVYTIGLLKCTDTLINKRKHPLRG